LRLRADPVLGIGCADQRSGRTKVKKPDTGRGSGDREKRLDHEDDGAAGGHLARYSGEFLGGGVRGEQRGRNNFKNHTHRNGMADGELDHVRPNAGVLNAKRRHSVGFRLFLVDNFCDGPRRRDAQRERNFYAC
jgi:hypothetical protein